MMNGNRSVGFEDFPIMSGARFILGTNEDLELRLAPPLVYKSAMQICGPCRPSVIILDDDYDNGDEDDDDNEDEDLQTRNFLPHSNLRASELSEEDLELRLGHTAAGGGTHISQQAMHAYAKNKLNPSFPVQPNLPPSATPKPNAKPAGKEVKLRCTICMDAMREETSTTCGHVFCRPCIANAVIFQKKCPTCRTKLSLQHIHRIYLPASTS